MNAEFLTRVTMMAEFGRYSQRRCSQRRCSRRRGTTVVEFAVTLPLVLLLFFGSIEFARVNMLRHTVAQAAYEGARKGIVPGATADEVRTAAQQILDSAFASSYTITVSPSTITRSTTEVTVNISLPLATNSWIVPDFFAGKTMTKSFTLQREKNDLVAVP